MTAGKYKIDGKKTDIGLGALINSAKPSKKTRRKTERKEERRKSSFSS
jgi:hypothetical protein